jgi:hypothetical protein
MDPPAVMTSTSSPAVTIQSTARLAVASAPPALDQNQRRPRRAEAPCGARPLRPWRSTAWPRARGAAPRSRRSTKRAGEGQGPAGWHGGGRGPSVAFCEASALVEPRRAVVVSGESSTSVGGPLPGLVLARLGAGGVGSGLRGRSDGEHVALGCGVRGPRGSTPSARPIASTWSAVAMRPGPRGSPSGFPCTWGPPNGLGSRQDFGVAMSAPRLGSSRPSAASRRSSALRMSTRSASDRVSERPWIENRGIHASTRASVAASGRR